MDKKYKSLRSGNTKTKIPYFQPVKPKKLNQSNDVGNSSEEKGSITKENKK